MSLVYVGVTVYQVYTTNIISNESIIIFGMILAHHLTLLGINKKHEKKEAKPLDKKPENIVG